MMMISVCVGHSTFKPAGISLTTGCENPTCKFSLLPWAAARKPTPTRESFFSKPLATPSTILDSKARIVPLMALACGLSLAGSTCKNPASLLMLTRGLAARTKVPLLPLTVID